MCVLLFYVLNFFVWTYIISIHVYSLFPCDKQRKTPKAAFKFPIVNGPNITKNPFEFLIVNGSKINKKPNQIPHSTWAKEIYILCPNSPLIG